MVTRQAPRASCQCAPRNTRCSMHGKGHNHQWHRQEPLSLPTVPQGMDWRGDRFLVLFTCPHERSSPICYINGGGSLIPEDSSNIHRVCTIQKKTPAQWEIHTSLRRPCTCPELLRIHQPTPNSPHTDSPWIFASSGVLLVGLRTGAEEGQALKIKSKTSRG